MTNFEQEKMHEIRKQVYDKMEDKIAYAWNRWNDEKEHEDFKAYEMYLKDNFVNYKLQGTFIKATKRPFGIIYQVGNYQIHLTCKRQGNSLNFISNIKKV